MKTLEEIEAILNETSASNKSEIASFELKIKEAEEEIEQAKAEKTIAEDNADVERFKKAKDDAWTAECKKELFVKRKNKAESAKLFNDSDYNNLTNNIINFAKFINDEQVKEMANPVKQLKKIADNSLELQNKATELLTQLQAMVKANPITETPDGGRHHKALPSIRIDRTAYSYFSETVGKSPSLLKIAGVFEEQNNKKRSW